MALLQVEDMHTFYGNIEALKGVSLTVEEGEIVTLIGSNGAGKSTTLRSISGLSPPRSGSIRFDGKEISRTPPQDIVRYGISQSPEARRATSSAKFAFCSTSRIVVPCRSISTIVS